MVCFVCFFLKEIFSDTRIFQCIKKFPLVQKNIMSSKLSAFPAAVGKSRGDTLFHHVSRVFVRRPGTPLSFIKESCRQTSQRLITTPSRLGSCTNTVDTGHFVTKMAAFASLLLLPWNTKTTATATYKKLILVYVWFQRGYSLSRCGDTAQVADMDGLGTRN